MHHLSQAILTLNEKYERIVYVSAGNVPDIKVLTEKCEHLSLYIANQEEYEACAAQNSVLVNRGQLSVHNSVIRSTSEKRPFYHASIASLSSSLEPSGILKLYPGVSFSAIDSISSITIQSLISTNVSTSSQKSLLVLDFNGEEIFLEAFLEDIVDYFESIIIRTSVQAMYGENPSPLSTVVEQFKTLNLHTITLPDPTPPFVNVVMPGAKQWRQMYSTSKDLMSENSLLRGQLDEEKNVNDEGNAKSEELKGHIAELEVKLEEATRLYSENKSRLSESDAKIQSLNDKKEELSSDKASLSQECIRFKSFFEESKQRLEVLESQYQEASEKEKAALNVNETLRSEMASLKSTLNSETEKRQNLEEQVHSLVNDINDYQEQNNHLTIELKEVKEQRDEQKKYNEEHKKWALSLKDEVEKFEAMISDKERSAILNQRLLAKAHVDLEDLRASYAEKVTSENELIELITELQEKLTLASRYYFKLQKEHPELMSVAKQEQVE